MAARQVIEVGRDKSEDDKGVRKYARRFVVQTDLGDTDTLAVAAVGITRYTPHPEDFGAIAKSARGARVKGALDLFEVTVEYDSAPFDRGSSGSHPSNTSNETTPTSRVPVVKFGAVHLTEPLGP